MARTSSEKDREYFWRNRYLLSPAVTAEHFGVPSLRASLEDALGLLGSPAGVLVQRVLPSDPTGELLRLLEALDAQTKPATREGVWFSPDNARALLLAQTRAPGYDIDGQEQAVGAIRAAHTKAAAEAGAELKLMMTGPGVFSVTARQRIKDDALRSRSSRPGSSAPCCSPFIARGACSDWGSCRSPRAR